MAVEVERKFLVSSNAWRQRICGQQQIRQAYLSCTEQSSTRVRIVDDCQALVTIKAGPRGLVRQEFEYTIPLVDARQLMRVRISGIVEKTRYLVNANGSTWEVDEFLLQNAGLVIAEIELDDAGSEIVLPDWIDLEVTGQKQYHNSQLALRPYSTWQDQEQKPGDRRKLLPHDADVSLSAA